MHLLATWQLWPFQRSRSSISWGGIVDWATLGGGLSGGKTHRWGEGGVQKCEDTMSLGNHFDNLALKSSIRIEHNGFCFLNTWKYCYEVFAKGFKLLLILTWRSAKTCCETSFIVYSYVIIHSFNLHISNLLANGKYFL